MKRTLGIILVIVMSIAIFAGCSMADKSEEFSNSESTVDFGKEASVENLTKGAMPAPAPMIKAAADVNESGGVYKEGRKAIKTGNVQMEVDSYQTTYEIIKSMLGENGYIEESSIWKTPIYIKGEKYLITNGSLRLRIKADVFISFTEGLNGIGTVLSASTNEDDISDMYYDTEGRLELKKKEKERLEEYADKIDDPETFFRTQSRITEVIYEIERLQGTLKKWDSKVDYSTVYITINERNPEEGSALPVPKGFFGKIWDNLKAGVSFLGDVIIFLAGALPALILIGVLVFVAIIIIRRLTGKPNRKKNKNDDAE